MPAGLTQQIDRMTTGLINTINDSVAGGLVSPTGLARYASQAGERIILGSESLRYSSSVGTVYPGMFQYVQLLASAATAPQRGGLCFWNDRLNGIVTTDVAAASIGDFAGVILNPNVTLGNWTFIQVLGIVFTKFRAAITKAAPAIGDIVIVDNTPTPTADILADATTLTSPLLKTWIGRAVLQAPTNGGLTPVELQPKNLEF